MATAPIILTPSARPRRRFPRVALGLTLGGVGLSAAVSPFSGLVASVLTGISVFAAILGAWWLAAWLEQQLFDWLALKPHLRRVGLSLVMPPLASVALIAAAGFLGSVLPKPLDLVELAMIFGAIWLGSAGLGSLIVVIIDSLVSAVVSDLRSRIQVAVLALVALGAALSVVLVRSGQGFLLKAMSSGKLSVSSGDQTFKGPELTALMSSEDTRHALIAALAAIAFLLIVPAVISACGKLADSVMERLHPLAAGFRSVGEGQLEVRVEEKGSRDFVELSRAFNRMVEALSLARRMELTFGVYLGRQVTERIRAQHGEAAIPASAREASVLFADVRGFTAMSERLEPSQVLGLLNRYFEQVVAVIDAHEGYLNKFVGDAVVVVFNGPIDQPDHVERAVRCAIALQEAVERLNRAGAFPEVGELRVGIGIATGPVVAGNLGSSRQMEYTVIGDTVNLASRLTSKAPAGEVWISERSAAGLPDSIARERLEPLQVKGKHDPVVPYRVWPQPAESAAASNG